ncbi:MAG: BrnT family toxin [Deltaproteobacteria bacterium]|nr:BrnT family toxin [Deltaproteobacteria bacterium]
MIFEWDNEKSNTNRVKHGIDFDTAKALWDDGNRVEIQSPYPLESRRILIAKLDKKLWTAIFTQRASAIRIISVRRTRKREANLYGQKENG